MKYFQLQKFPYQTTLKKGFIIKGRSLANNHQVLVNCQPARPDMGLVFVVNNKPIKANWKNFKKSEFHTTMLAKNKVCVMTVEHILSAFYGLQIDNALIELKGDNQLPLLDASSALYARKILAVGIKRFNQPKNILRVNNTYFIKSDINGGFIIFLPDKKFVLKAIIDFNNLISSQIFEYQPTSPKDYYKKISLARTFLIKPFAQKRWQQIRRQINCLPQDPAKSDILVYDRQKYLNKLRYKNEPVRHKVLDFLGDLSLLGYQLVGKIIVYKPGHYFTYQIIREISKLI